MCPFSIYYPGFYENGLDKCNTMLNIDLIHARMVSANKRRCYIFDVFSHCMKQILALTHWGRDKMDAISQTTFSSAFSWMKIFEFRLKFHCSLLPGVQLTIFQHWFRWWLGAVQATSHYLNQWWVIYRRIYASLGLNELSSDKVV